MVERIFLGRMNKAKRKSMLAIGELENGVTLDLAGK